MTQFQFVEKVSEMRNAQKQYFRTRSSEILSHAKQLEREVDACKHFIDTEHCSKCKYIEICQTGIAHNALKNNKSELPISMAREAAK